MTEEIMPFGMLFKEPALELPQVLVPFYNEELDISCIQIADGQLIPYVELDERLSGTQTATRVKKENTDTDPQDVSSGIYAALGTATFTEVRKESTDQDPSPPPQTEPPKRPLGTETITLIQSEGTQRDY